SLLHGPRRAFIPGTRQLDQAVARSGVHACASWICCYETDKKDVGVRRPPTAFLLPIVARMEIRHFRLKRAAYDTITRCCRFVKWLVATGKIAKVTGRE